MPNTKDEFDQPLTRPVIRLWDWQNGELKVHEELKLNPFQEYVPTTVESGWFSADGRQFASFVNLMQDRCLQRQHQFWELRDQKTKPIGHLDVTETDSNSFAYAPVGRKGLTLQSTSRRDIQGTGTHIRLWDLTEGKPRPEREDRNVLGRYRFGGFREPAYSPDGELLAVANGERLLIWSVATGKTILERDLPGLFEMAFAPDSRHLLLGNANGTVFVLRLRPSPAENP